MSVKDKFQLCMVGHNTKEIRQASAKLDLTITNVDLTNVRCQNVIIGPETIIPSGLLVNPRLHYCCTAHQALLCFALLWLLFVL